GLEEIEQFLMPKNLPSSTRNLSLEIPILIKIAQPAKPLWLLIAPALLTAILLIGAIVMLNTQTAYRLRGPEGEKILKLRPIASIPLIIGDEDVGKLIRRFGTITVYSFPPFKLEHGVEKQRLNANSDGFVVTNSDNNRSWTFSIEALTRREKEES